MRPVSLVPVLFGCLGGLAAQSVSIKLTTNELGLGSADINAGSTVNADVAGKLITSPTTGKGSILTVQRSGLAGTGTPADPLLCTITARTNLDTTSNLPQTPHDYYAGILYITKENSTTPDGTDEGIGVRAFTVNGTTALRTLSSGKAKIEGSNEISGGTGPKNYNKYDANGGWHVDEGVTFTFNPVLAVLATKTTVIVSKFESIDRLDLQVTMASGKKLELLSQSTNNTTLFTAISASKGLWRLNLKALPGITDWDLLSSFTVTADENNLSCPAMDPEHFLVTGFDTTITNDCTPGFTLLGTPAIGKAVTIVMTARPGCNACAVLSFNPGPILLGNLVIHAGLPFLHIISGTLPPGGLIEVPVTIPNMPSLVGQKVYLGGVSLSGVTLTSTPPFSFTIVR